jgi:hypothetical protein
MPQSLMACGILHLHHLLQYVPKWPFDDNRDTGGEVKSESADPEFMAAT